MDNLRFNKFAAGMLCAGLLVMIGIKGAEILIPHHDDAHHGDSHAEVKHAYPIEVPDSPTTGVVAAAEPQGPEPILALLAAADIMAGEKLSRKCTACHSFDEGGRNKVGPNLWNIVGAGRGKVEGFSYSAAFNALDGKWSYEELNGFLYRPKDWIEGTKMNYVGLRKPQDRANMIAWLRQLSASPIPLPTPEEIASEEAADEATTELDASGASGESEEPDASGDSSQ